MIVTSPSLKHPKTLWIGSNTQPFDILTDMCPAVILILHNQLLLLENFPLWLVIIQLCQVF